WLSRRLTAWLRARCLVLRLGDGRRRQARGVGGRRDGGAGPDAARVEHGPTGAGYRLLETLREFGIQRLAERQLRDDVQRLHAEWYGRVAERIGTQWSTRDCAGFGTKMDADWANLREACS